MLNTMFWKKVRGKNILGGERLQKANYLVSKKLFKTNTKDHKHPSIRLFIIEQDTTGKPKKTKSGIQHNGQSHWHVITGQYQVKCVSSNMCW